MCSSSMYCLGPLSAQLPDRNTGKNPDFPSGGDLTIIPVPNSWTQIK